MRGRRAAAVRALSAPLPLLLLLLAAAAPAAARTFGALRGVELHACVLVEDPFIYSDPSRRLGFSGVAMSYLDRLNDNLQFRVTAARWTDSFSAFIETMATCTPATRQGAGENQCPCDVGVGAFTMTDARADVISFVWPFANEAHMMVSRKSDLRLDEAENRWFSFRTFSLSVWICVFAAIVLFGFGTLAFVPLSPSVRSSKPLAANASPLRRAIDTMCYFPAVFLSGYAHLLGETDENVSGPPGRPSFNRTAWMLLGIMMGFFLVTLYGSSLTILLFSGEKVSPFQSLDDLLECRIDGARVAMIDGGASQDLWNRAVNTSVVRARCGKSSLGVTVEDINDAFVQLRSGRIDYFYSLEGSVLFNAQRNCRLYEAVGEAFFSTSVAFVMPRQANTSLLAEFSRETRYLLEHDSFTNAAVLAEKTQCEKEIDPAISVDKMWEFFMLGGVVFGALMIYRAVYLVRLLRRRQTAGIDGQKQDAV